MRLKSFNFIFQSDKNALFVLLSFAIIITSAEFLIFDLLSEVNLYTAYTADQIEYFDAETLLFEEFRAHPTRPIGFPVFLRIVRILGGGNFVYSYFLFFQFLCWFFTAVVIFKAISIWKNRSTALLFSLIFLCIGAPSARFLWILTEPVYTLVLATSVFFVFQYFKSKKDKYLLFFWLLLCFSLTVRTTLFYSSVLILQFLIWYFFKQKKYAKSILSIAIFTFFVGLQSFLMHKETGEYKLSYIAEITVFYYYDAYLQAFLYTDDKEDRDVYWGKLNKLRRAELCLESDDFSVNLLYKKDWASSAQSIKKNVLASITAHPATAAKTYLRNFIQNSTGGNDMIFNTQNKYPKITKLYWWLTRLQNLLLTGTFLLLTLNFFIEIIRARKLPTNLLLLVPLLLVFNLVLTDPITFAQGDRFHVVFYPIVLILFACRKEYIIKLTKQKPAAN